MIFELINPSDPYTFEADSLEVAGYCACLLSTGFGAVCHETGERTPVMFGWDEWLESRFIDDAWAREHAGEIAKAFDSFLIGDVNKRADVASMLAIIPEEKRQKWKEERQDRHRTSVNRIGEVAYHLALDYQALADQLTNRSNPSGDERRETRLKKDTP